jgi:NADPH:quinone reductase-like Zn-dependent oxidoreductase
METMKAARINEWGQPATVEEIEQPTAGPGEVLVRVHAASVNQIDRAIAAGYLQMMYTAPLTPGTDFSGEVVAVGADVQHVTPGTAVYGMNLNRGTFAEYVVVTAAGVAPKPQSLDHVHAAAVPIAGLSAWQTLYTLARLQPSERILIHGAGGGIGSFAVQLAKNTGAYVIAHDKADSSAFLEQLGADEVVAADNQRFEEVVGTVDVVLDLVGGDYVERSFAVLQAGGRYVTTAAQLSPDAGKEQGIVAAGTFTQPTVDELRQLADAIDTGKLKVFVNATYPLADIQTALYAKPQGQAPGKVVVTIV